MALGDIHWADSYQPAFGLPHVPLPDKKTLERMSDAQLEKLFLLRQELERAAAENPIGNGWTLPMWNQVMAAWKNYNNFVILGGNRCLHGDSLIYDPILGISRPIKSIKGDHNVWAWDGKRLVVTKAEQPFTKPAGMMLRVRLSNNREVVAALEHRVLSLDGSWKPISELHVGDVLFHPRTTSGTYPANQTQGAPRWFETASDFQACYPSESHLCDEPPHAGEDSGLDASQELGGVPTHIFASDNTRRYTSTASPRSPAGKKDGRVGKLSRIHAWIESFLRSIRDGLHLPSDPFAGTLCHASYTPCKSASLLHADQGFHGDGSQSSAGYLRSQSSYEFGLSGKQSCHEWAYVTHITKAGIAVKWDMTVPAYGNYWHEGLIHHNSSKSWFASRLCVWAALNIPGAEVRCYHVNEDRSIEDQQRMIYDALPAFIKNLPTKKGTHHSIQYSQKNGFTDNICILPPLPGAKRGGTIKFGNYRQYQQDAQVGEGFKSHLIWCDEECPQKFFETLQYRIVDYHGRIILTFTTLTGWTPLVQDILGKTVTMKRRMAPLLGRELPTWQESRSRPNTGIFYFWTEDNAFLDTSDFVKTMRGRPKDEVLARAYGIPTKSVTSVFPGFNKEVNVIPHENLPWLKNPEYKTTRFMACDPAGSKNWFMLWVAIDAAGTWWVYREWPDYDDWALPGNTIEGKAGPAQKGSKKGIKDYVELIRDCEKDEEIYERYIDPRLGAAEKQSADGATTIISDLDAEDMTFIPAPGVEIENGLQLINNLLSYDDTKPIDSLNAPKLYISDRCSNLIYSMQEYTARGGREEASKDPIDVLRYLCVSNCSFVEEVAQGSERRSFSY